MLANFPRHVALRMLSLLASVAWVPRTAAGLRNYWRGNWKLAKEISYERGGLSGTFTGARLAQPCAHITSASHYST